MSEQLPTPPQPPAGIITHRDLAYVTNGHERQKLDLYLPAENAKRGAASPKQRGENFPLIIWVHGGAFRMGSKEGNADNPPPFAYLTQGYAVASINYRLSQHASGRRRLKIAKPRCAGYVPMPPRTTLTPIDLPRGDRQRVVTWWRC